MSADLFILIKNDFDDIKDLAKSSIYGNSVKYNLEKQLGKEAINDFICSTDEEGLAFVSLKLEPYCVTLTLRNGFWIVYNGNHHRDLIDDYKGRFPISETAQKVAMLFGEKEVWYTCDISMEQYECTISLEELISEMQNKDCYAEFNRSELLKIASSKRPLYSLYHELFEL